MKINFTNFSKPKQTRKFNKPKHLYFYWFSFVAHTFIGEPIISYLRSLLTRSAKSFFIFRFLNQDLFKKQTNLKRTVLTLKIRLPKKKLVLR